MGGCLSEARRLCVRVFVSILILVGFFAGSLRGEEGIVTAGFKRIVWSEKLRARVNSPDVATGPYKDRWEAKETGLVTVTLDDDPSGVMAAHVYLELWGGHPGVAEKAFTFGKKKYTLPKVGAAADNCTYSYPIVEIDASKLVKGENVLAFSCTKGTTFWGHYMIDNTCLVLDLERTHPAIHKMDLASFEASVRALPLEGQPEALALSVSLPEGLAGKVAAVEYRGRYTGYDENGDGRSSDWHGFTRGRRAEAIIGRADRPPYEVVWDTSMLPDQDGPLEVQALVRFASSDGIVYITAPLGKLALPKRDGRAVGMFAPEELPRPFWSRASEVKTCIINLPVDPNQVERAQLHVNIWDGGKGDVADPFTLNGHPLPVAGDGEHDLIYRVVEVDPAILKKGANEIRLLSDTEHHGIEVLLPGPTLVVRYRTPAVSP